MSEAIVDLTLVLRNTERAARAAEAALAIYQRMEGELGHRLGAMEARLSGLESRIPALAAGVNSVERGQVRLNDKLLDHDGRFDRIDARLDAILARLTGDQP
jgi:hypothetical protein